MGAVLLLSDALLLWSIIRNSWLRVFFCLFVFFSFLAVSLRSCGVLVPNQGSNSCLLQWNQPLNHQGSPLTAFFFFQMAEDYLSLPRFLSKVSWQKKARRSLNGFQPVTLILNTDWPLQTFEFRLRGEVCNLRAHGLCSLGKPSDLISALSLINCEAHTSDLLSQKWK